MLLEFTVGNYRSIRAPITLSMIATSLKGMNADVDSRACATLPDGRAVLRSSAIYGPNAGGKSNLLQAPGVLRLLVLDSAREGRTGDRLPVEPFLLDADSDHRPTTLELVFVADDVQYRYGVEVTSLAVGREWLYRRALSEARATRLFQRAGQKITRGRGFPEGRRLEEKTRDNALFLSVCAQFNGPVSKCVETWFKRLAVFNI